MDGASDIDDTLCLAGSDRRGGCDGIGGARSSRADLPGAGNRPVSSVVLRQLFADYWRWHLANQPEDATRVGVHSFDDRWQDWSMTARAAARERRQEFLRNFQYAGLGNLTNRERMSLALIQQRLAAEASTENLRLLSRLAPGGAHAEVFRVVRLMPTGAVSDYERLLARLRALPAYVEQHIEVWSEQLVGGMTQPASVVDRVVVGYRGATPDRRGPFAAPRGISQLPCLGPRRRTCAPRAGGRHGLRRAVRPGVGTARTVPARHLPAARPSQSLGRPAAGRHRPILRTSRLLRRPGRAGGHAARAGDGRGRSPGAGGGGSESEWRCVCPGGRDRWRRRGARVRSRIPGGTFVPAFEDGWRVFAGPRTRLAFETAIKAALDSGIHVRGWSRAEALAFATTNLGGEAGDVVDIVASTPARALAVFAGARKFAALQQAARAKLGERFDQRVFNRTVLDGGVLPLDLVELEIEELLKARPAGTP